MSAPYCHCVMLATLQLSAGMLLGHSSLQVLLRPWEVFLRKLENKFFLKNRKNHKILQLRSCVIHPSPLSNTLKCRRKGSSLLGDLQGRRFCFASQQVIPKHSLPWRWVCFLFAVSLYLYNDRSLPFTSHLKQSPLLAFINERTFPQEVGWEEFVSCCFPVAFFYRLVTGKILDS